jgi:hypothetical protein
MFRFVNAALLGEAIARESEPNAAELGSNALIVQA